MTKIWIVTLTDPTDGIVYQEAFTNMDMALAAEQPGTMKKYLLEKYGEEMRDAYGKMERGFAKRELIEP